MADSKVVCCINHQRSGYKFLQNSDSTDGINGTGVVFSNKYLFDIEMAQERENMLFVDLPESYILALKCFDQIYIKVPFKLRSSISLLFYL